MTSRVYNPAEITVFMKKVTRDGNDFYIGNWPDMDLNLSDSVLRFYPPDGDNRPVIVINKRQPKPDDRDETDDGYDDPVEGRDDR